MRYMLTVFVVWAGLGFLGASISWAAPDGDPLALLVVVPEKMPLGAPAVEHWIDLLKIERERKRLSPEELPLLRLSMARAQHRTVLQKLGLSDSDKIRTFTCRRDSGGWPNEILIAHEVGTPADVILARVVKHKEAPEPVVSSTVGLLLVADKASRTATEPFLQELGRFWLQRYGRVRPSPYPLASYDMEQAETAEALRRVFPKLTDGDFPVVALCVFEQGQPTEILQVYRGLDTPASLVREISAARGQAITAVRRPDTTAALPTIPGQQEFGLSDQQERLLLISRLNETAQQLWNDAKDDQAPRNQSPKRLLLRVIEESRRYLGGETAALALLLETLKDYEVEPLLLERSSKASEQSTRFLELSKSLTRPSP